MTELLDVVSYSYVKLAKKRDSTGIAMVSLTHLSFLLLVTSSLTRGISDDVVGDSFKRHFNLYFYPELKEKVRHLYDYETLDADFSQRTNCSLQEFWQDLDNETRASYLDSFGKVGAGILKGNVIYPGYYDQCIDIGNTDYCLFPFDVILTAEGHFNRSVTIPLEFGMCFPSSCDENDFYHLFYSGLGEIFYAKSFTDVNAMTYMINFTASIKYTEPVCPWRDLKWTNSSIILLAVCILLVGLVITGTVVDLSLWFLNDIWPNLLLYKARRQEAREYSTPPKCEVKNSVNEDEPLINAKPKLMANPRVINKPFIEFIKDLVLSFSLYKTIPTIMSTHQPATAITSINGIRVISMFWVILGHVTFWPWQTLIYANSLEFYEKMPKHFLFQPIINFTLSVDSFFVLSGLLLSYLTMKEMKRNQGKFTFISFYLHRLLRLSPAYYLVVVLYFKLFPYIGSGPFWLFKDEVDNCEKYWWTDILYINNFYPASYTDMCYVLSWYLAVVMQFFMISPIFLLLLYHFWEIGFAVIAGTVLTSIAIIGTVVGIKDYNVIGVDPSFNMIYEKPYCRINAYLIGIVLGFILYKQWRARYKLWINICFYSVTWIIAISCCFIIVFGQYKARNGHPFTKAENIMYYMFNRTVFSIGIALMIYACHNGFGGITDKFLSWSYWIPLSRLTYMAFLFHVIVIILMYRTLRFRFIYTNWSMIVMFAAAVTLSYSLSLIIAVTVEYPVANMEIAFYKFAGIKKRK